jgi:diacylglycerol kinase family enzyme
MYFYILDGQHVDSRTVERAHVEIQGLLAQFRVTGEIARVTSLRTIKELVETASQRGAKTLVACGTDETFNLMLAYIAGRDFTLAFIPITTNSYLGQIFGLDSIFTAVKTIAARRVERLDLAVMGEHYFINQVEFGLPHQPSTSDHWWSGLKLLSLPERQITLRIDNTYTVQAIGQGGIICNSRVTSSSNSAIANPTDGLLDVMLLGKLDRLALLHYKQQLTHKLLEQIPGTSVIKCCRVDILEPKGLSLTIAGKVFAKAPASIEIIPRQLKIIVGKNRTF